MINTILCFLVGHRLSLKGSFQFVRPDWYINNKRQKVKCLRCFRCGNEVERKAV